MKKNLITAILMTVVTTVLLGVIYPLVVTGLAQIWRDKANGQLITRKDGTVIGSRIIGQAFVGDAYFHSRPSAAGNGYDAANSGGTNLGPTNKALVDRVNTQAAALQKENPGQPVPIDLVTTSGSGLDPHITPAAAAFQIPRVAQARGITDNDLPKLKQLVSEHTENRQFGILGEPRVNVLELNIALDEKFPVKRTASRR
ncbi:MAG TPA: potassium-transporting ATPase subunit KdpC [Candidatus Angelobacter sp.]|nr:potassium-transporting ATPase subunit KdpC [Candidatus Angelobacter sp.]